MNVKTVASIRARVGSRGARHMQRGATLLEAIAYLGIAAIVVIGAIALLRGAFGSASSNQTAEQVTAIQTGVKKLYMGQTNGYNGLTTTVAIAAGIIPTTLVIDTAANTVTDAWGGAVTVAGTGTGTFTITFDAVPTDVCINAASAGGTWTAVSIGDTPQAVPVTPAAAQAACAGGAKKIVWTSA
ncbi:type 4 pilus major pilin [Burkholderia sp. BCCIQ04A]|uniref:Type 4 pilus major pilin n=1 Tax=Burkholderia anthinoferrum TaxID=3090833 RepID=A0ABU5WMU3_9BURK|nr:MULTISPECIES: type 4 pilus major pilin [Burkholderia]MEB2504132.1 type 4 pilus major pilin [Burkholderia anthinoferrum]MEB2530346.1 type 4 pilus major pilin [Burkholderia anthinoferrum]MEB2562888.1 type 4 pilus major pilin [Burkholderia anthinoferrum]MEB2580291.1 type 4 pilus major pilin [Burkholderia anthinoferrum]MCA8106615.1 pilus assembly protein [Burkholderia sp. AU36459]